MRYCGSSQAATSANLRASIALLRKLCGAIMYATPRTFPCPNCKEIINDSMTTCRFCSVSIDPGIAALVAEQQAKANQAYSDASFLRTASVAMFVFLGLSLIPFVPFVYWGFLITFLVSVVLLVRWQIRFGTLTTSDPDYKKAKRSRSVALILVIVAIPMGFVVRPLLDLIVSQML
jgi:Ca2+/Na+ antiporter